MRWLLLFTAAFLLIAPLQLRAEEAAPAEGNAAVEGSPHEGAEGGEGEHKKKPDEKPRPDSVVSSVLALPVVKKWGEWMEAKGNGNHIVAWGEYIKAVHGSKCWSIVVAEENDAGNDTVWRRFCMQQTGLEIWVETTLGAPSPDETNYISYDKWATGCEPTFNSPGKC